MTEHISKIEVFEELGKSMVGVEVRIHGIVEPAEPRTHDYPGYPETTTYDRCEVLTIATETCVVNRADRPDWFVYLDEVVDAYIWNNLEKIYE